MRAILQRKNITNEEKATLYLQIHQKIVNIPFSNKNPDIMETVDAKQENFQNRSVDRMEDKRNTIASLPSNELVETIGNEHR
ncbi:hypothetical protein NPIL_77281, partial [Nephila pilipes]